MESEASNYCKLPSLHDGRTDSNSSLISVSGPAEGLNYRTNGHASKARATFVGVSQICWIISSGAALYTTKELVVSYDYPATIALIDFGSIALIYLVALFFGLESVHPREGGAVVRGVRRPAWVRLLPSPTWRGMLFPSLAAAASLPLLFQALLHMPSLPVLAMLFPIIYTTQSSIFFLHARLIPSQERHALPQFPWHAMIVMVASMLVLYNEYRLMVPGLVCGITSLILIGLARALFAIESRRSKHWGLENTLEAYHGFLIMALFSGVIFSSVMIYFFEQSGRIEVFSATFTIIIAQLFSVTIATVTGTSLLVFSPILFSDGQSSSSAISASSNDFLASSISSFLLISAGIFSRPKIVSSTFQFVSYAIAVVCIPGFSQLQTFALNVRCINSRTIRSYISASGVTMAAVAILVVSMVTILSLLEFASFDSLTSGQPLATLDLSYSPSSAFDIVVSAYKEEPQSIKAMLTSIKSTSLLSTLRPRIILYTKDEQANIAALKNSTGADIVIRLDNVGREGATYLHHIVRNWDGLAEKTMFIQAHAHNIRELIPRIDSYLIADTGMLSLGFTGIICRCGGCQDRWGWKDTQGVIPEVYESVYGNTCDDETSILLSYKGQFVASARRIRGISKTVYQRLLHAFKTGDSLIGNSTFGNQISEDSLDNPAFGFTMERLWSLVLQCATNSIVAARCPSLLSGKGFGGDIGDCQCLDSTYH